MENQRITAGKPRDQLISGLYIGYAGSRGLERAPSGPPIGAALATRLKWRRRGLPAKSSRATYSPFRSTVMVQRREVTCNGTAHARDRACQAVSGPSGAV